MSSTMIDLQDKLTYFSDQSDIISMIIIIITLLLPISFFIFFREKNILLLNPLYKNILRNLSLLFLSYIFALLFGILYRLYYEDGTISIRGSLSYSTFDSDCSDENNFSCCNYYDNCHISDIGIEGPIDHDTVIIPIKKNSQCPDLSEIIYKRDKYLDYDSVNCSKSKFGCCSIETTCNSYVKLNFPYSLYEHTIEKGYPYGYNTLMEPKIDEIGSNCPDTVTEIIEEYSHLHVESKSHSFAIIILSFIGILLICLGICIRNHIKEMNYNTLTEEESDNLENIDYP
jgi:uncharacterized membrane protein